MDGQNITTGKNISDIRQEIPGVTDYYKGINGWITFAISAGGFLSLLIIAVFLLSTLEIFKKVTKQYQLHTLLLCSVYPVVALAALLTILIPRSVLICHTIMHLSFTFLGCVFYQLCFLYVDGEDNFLKNASEDSLSLRTPPLCCCCICFRSMAPTKGRLCIIRAMIYQMPVIQTLIMIALNVIYVHDYEIYNVTLLYFAPFLIISILLGMWGLNIITKMMSIFLPEHKMRLKLLCLQLVLIFCKFQPIITESILRTVNFGGKYPITNTVYINVIIQIIILVLMLCLSLLAKKAYQKPTSL